MPVLGDAEDASPFAPRGRRSWRSRLATLLVVTLAAVLFLQVVGGVDWAAVGTALTHLAWWHPLVLVLVLLVRAVCNALPLALLIPGVSVVRATVCDLSAAVVASFSPPPSDLALRVMMLRSWGVPVGKGLAGVVMNMLTFYIVRLGTPVAGLALLLFLGEPVGWRWFDLLCVLGSLTLLGLLTAVVRSDTLARTVGGRGARIARAFGKDSDPTAWADGCSAFRVDVEERFRRGFPASLVATMGMVLADGILLILCLRFVGVSAEEVGPLVILAAHLCAYPFTALFFSGLGVVDALIVASVVAAAGVGVEASALAALIVWRAFTMLGPVVLGLVALTGWRLSLRRRGATPRARVEP